LFEIRQITDLDLWDGFIKGSRQGSLFSTTKWCKLFSDPFTIYGCYKGDDLQGGMIGFNTDQGFFSGGYPVTQFQGIIFKPGCENKYGITEGLIKAVDKATILNSYHANDIRPMLWAGWKPIVRYTYIIKNPSIDKLEKDTRYEILHNADSVWQGNLESFYPMYQQTFERKGLPVPVSMDWMQRFSDAFMPDIYMTDNAGAMIVQDWNIAYYIFGASTGENNSLKVVWEAIKNHNQIDTAGANSREIALYKRGFNGVLTPYLGATNV